MLSRSSTSVLATLMIFTGLVCLTLFSFFYASSRHYSERESNNNIRYGNGIDLQSDNNKAINNNTNTSLPNAIFCRVYEEGILLSNQFGKIWSEENTMCSPVDESGEELDASYKINLPSQLGGLDLSHAESGSLIVKVNNGRIQGDSVVGFTPADVELAESTPIHGRRNLQDSGKRSVLVLRVSVGDSEPEYTATEFRDLIFGFDDVTLQSQYFKCSSGKLMLYPADDVVQDGILDVRLQDRMLAEFETSTTLSNTAQVEAATILNLEAGRHISSLADHVMICLPPGTGDWIAAAATNHWRSVYNNKYCGILSASMHEIGHNLGLQHANQEGNYLDFTSYMSAGHFEERYPQKCFNGQNHYQLGWFSDKTLRLEDIDETVVVELASFVDYRNLGGSDENDNCVVLVSIDERYFLQFNQAKSFNWEVEEEQNKVTIVEKVEGGTELLGGIDVNTPMFRIKNYDETTRRRSSLVISVCDTISGEDYVDMMLISIGKDTATCPGEGSTESPTRKPSVLPTQQPTSLPSPAPTTQDPTTKPTLNPSLSPTIAPTPEPTRSPTNPPTRYPSQSPTFPPSRSPTNPPTRYPSQSPTIFPTSLPTHRPTRQPTSSPSLAPSLQPSPKPSTTPSDSIFPSFRPSPFPSTSSEPSSEPSNIPSASFSPSLQPSLEHSSFPTSSIEPTVEHSNAPSGSMAPTHQPTLPPTSPPSRPPTLPPTSPPTLLPTSPPTLAPTTFPTPQPTIAPTVSAAPTHQPTSSPTDSTYPSLHPTSSPSFSFPPSFEPTEYPSSSWNPTAGPSFAPSSSMVPTLGPTRAPFSSISPTVQSSFSPSSSTGPSLEASRAPSVSAFPSIQPSFAPSSSTGPSLEASHTPSGSTYPGIQPTSSPSASEKSNTERSREPSFIPSKMPSASISPSLLISSGPSSGPTTDESEKPSTIPSSVPTTDPPSITTPPTPSPLSSSEFDTLSSTPQPTLNPSILPTPWPIIFNHRPDTEYNQNFDSTMSSTTAPSASKTRTDGQHNNIFIRDPLMESRGRGAAPPPGSGGGVSIVPNVFSKVEETMITGTEATASSADDPLISRSSLLEGNSNAPPRPKGFVRRPPTEPRAQKNNLYH